MIMILFGGGGKRGGYDRVYWMGMLVLMVYIYFSRSRSSPSGEAGSCTDAKLTESLYCIGTCSMCAHGTLYRFRGPELRESNAHAGADVAADDLLC